MAAVGTLAWAAQTGGQLRTADRLALLAQGIALQLRVLPAQLRAALGLGGSRPRHLDPADVHPPDTQTAREAEEHCRAVSPPYLVNHCLRTYLWGRLLAAEARLTLDHELFWVASLLHDLGLTDRYQTAPSTAPCFAVRGAEAARKLALRTGWSRERQDALAEAITLHLNVRVGLEHGTEAHLLNASTALDVTGLRFWDLQHGTAEAVVARVPRLALKRDLWTRWKAEADAHPSCRGHFLNRYLQFGYRVRASPFADG